MNSGELKVNVPLATIDDEVEDDADEEDQQLKKKNLAAKSLTAARINEKSKSRSSSSNRRASPRFNLDGGDSVTGSLEDLVNSFDEKLSNVFHDYKEQVDKIAPVQVRSQEEIMNECQVWWTITGNFGNMMPIDWSKSTTRAKHLATLNLNTSSDKGVRLDEDDDEGKENEEEDDIIRADLDMHSLILRNQQDGSEPLVTADDVIKEIDDMIEEDERAVEEADEALGESGRFSSHRGLPGSGLTSLQKSSLIVHQALSGKRLEDLSVNELTKLLNDIEVLVRDLSEELVTDLGIRDELEYEKELKNNFISLLLSIQSKRRQSKGSDKSTIGAKRDQNKYLNTVIPYHPDRGTPDVQNLQVLVKLLKAVNEDSPAVPAMLTDYILKVLCPSS